MPALLEKSLERGWRVVVQASSEERVDALDAHLWTWRDDFFLPHGTARQGGGPHQPILLTVSDDNPNGARALPGRRCADAGGRRRLPARCAAF